MNLNGKALELFEAWLKEKDPFLFDGYNPNLKLSDLHYHLLNSYIIEWLDSIGYLIEIGIDQTSSPKFDFIITKYEYFGNYKKLFSDGLFRTRPEAISKAIEKCNELINLK